MSSGQPRPHSEHLSKQKTIHPRHHKLGVVGARLPLQQEECQEDQGIKVSLSFVESSRPAWAT